MVFHQDQRNLTQDGETVANLQVIKPQWFPVGAQCTVCRKLSVMCVIITIITRHIQKKDLQLNISVFAGKAVQYIYSYSGLTLVFDLINTYFESAGSQIGSSRFEQNGASRFSRLWVDLCPNYLI